MPACAIYTRVSTDIQAEHGYSLETQIAACREAAQRLGADVIQEYIDDGYSGAYLERPALDALRDALHAKTYDVVICYTPDRLARRLSHQLLLTEEIEKSGATLQFVSGEYKDTPEGRMLLQMQGVFAEYEREKIRERTMRGRRGKLRSGQPITDSHVFGYDFVDGKYVVNEAEAAVVRLVFDLYINGNIGGTKFVAAYLTKAGIPSATGLPYWYPNVINRLLRQEMYTGTYRANRFGSQKIAAHKKRQFVKPESEWITMSCPRIIDDDLFRAAQDRLRANRFVRKLPVTAKYLLQGIIRCGVCGRPMGINNRANRLSKYYKCTGGRVDPRDFVYKCNARSGRANLIDAAVWESLETICATEKSMRRYVTARNAPRKPEHNIIDINTRAEEIKGLKTAIMEWVLKGLISREDATARLEKLAEEERVLKAKPVPPPEPQIDYAGIVAAVKSCPDDFDARRRVLLRCVEAVYVTRLDVKRKTNNYELKIEIKFH